MPLLNQLLDLRMKYEAGTIQQAHAMYEKLQRAMLKVFLEENKPKTLSDYLWLTSEFRMRSLPLIRWLPDDRTANAVILCVHGMGLENRAFRAFADQMTPKHFIVYAMDVRGFGAWQNEYGEDVMNFNRALSDIPTIIRIIRYNHPGLPVFLLGESMGGAIVLRAASEFGSDMDGVISSAPSAERYGETKMAAQVALHLLSPNKAFNVGTELGYQETSDESLRKLLLSDPKEKNDLTSKELMTFNSFMKTTQKRCTQIRTTPVVVVQGMADKLAKPKGSYEMFDNVQSPDKTMIIIGSAEHLMIETPKQSKVLLDGLAAWLNDHAVAKQPKTSQAAPPAR
jgi:alpha-beta hydrolase superfamily lysophospholipase